MFKTTTTYVLNYFFTFFLALVSLTTTNIITINDVNRSVKTMFSFSKGSATKANVIATKSNITDLYLKKLILIII